MKIEESLKELRKLKKRNFSQSFDLIINLKGIDIKRDNITAIISVPNKIKDKKVCGFFEKKSSVVKTITEPDFQKYKDKKMLKDLVKEFDFFIAQASLMPKVATNFGKALGPTGKMPSPQLGILPNSDEKLIHPLLEKIAKAVKIRVKEPTIKLVVGNEKMNDNEVIDNIHAIYEGLVKILPTKQENIKSILLKLTMSKPIKVELK